MAEAHSKNHSRFVKRLQWATKGSSLKQCKYLGNYNYFGMITTEDGENSKLDPIKKTKLLLFTKKGKLLQKFQLEAKETSFFDRNKDTYQHIHLTLSQDRRLLAVCKNTPKTNSLEIEIWNVRKNQRVNIFKLNKSFCDNSPIFDQSITKVAYISLQGKLAIWNISSGIRLPISEPIRSLSCLNLSNDFTQAYCYKHSSLIQSYSLDKSGKPIAVTHPQNMYPNKVFGFLLESLDKIKIKVPNLFYSIGMDRPELARLYKRENESIHFYRTPNARRGNQQQQYKSILVRSKLDTGELIDTLEYDEPFDIRLANLKYSSKQQLLLGEDRTIDKDNYRAFFAVSFKDKQKHRFGVECAHDWELIPGSQHIITCGHCNSQNKIKIWDTLPKNP